MKNLSLMLNPAEPIIYSFLQFVFILLFSEINDDDFGGRKTFYFIKTHLLLAS